jgi:hypothetical protein
MMKTIEKPLGKNRIWRAVRDQEPLVITTFTLPRSVEGEIEQAVSLFLGQIEQEPLKDHILYCVQELAVNAKKANTKRVYFLEKGLDLDNPADYLTGMKTFKDDTFNNIGHYLDLQEQKGLYIKLCFYGDEEGVTIEVRNNTAMTPSEYERVKKRLEWANRHGEGDSPAFFFDETEGAGLGLIIMVLMMKKMGFKGKNIDVKTTDSETIARIVIPRRKRGKRAA